MLINLTNDLTKNQGNQVTYLAQAVSAGGTQAGVKNIAGLNASWAVQLGQTGEETAEIINLSSTNPSGTILTFGTSPSHSAGTLLFGHNLDTPVYQIHYDQVIFYRSTTGTAGPFSSLATISITPDQPYTQYNDSTGAQGYAYYAQYYNSVNGDIGGSSGISIPGGPTNYSLQKLKQRSKDKLYSAGYIKSDDPIIDWINEWYELMVNAAIKVNQGYMLGTAGYGFGTSGYGTVTDSFFKQAVKVEVTFDGVTYIPSVEIAPREYSDADFFNASSPRHAWVGETVFQILPHNQSGTARITYSQRFTPLVSDADEVTQTLKAYTTSCVEYVLSVAYGLDQKDSQQQEHFEKYLKYQNDFIAEITPRDQTSAKLIDTTESISGLEDDVATEYSEWVW